MRARWHRLAGVVVVLAPEVVDVVAELRAAMRTGFDPGSAGKEQFGGRDRWRITREQTRGASTLRDSWFIDAERSSLVGMRRERWVGEVLQDNLTYVLVRHEPVPPGDVRAALAFAAGQ